LQDAKISLERLSEIHSQKDEESDIAEKMSVLPKDRTIKIENLSYSYDGADRDYALNEIHPFFILQ
jgi:ATP-binding cassette subfamily B protein